jgi:hypothetical protein
MLSRTCAVMLLGFALGACNTPRRPLVQTMPSSTISALDATRVPAVPAPKAASQPIAELAALKDPVCEVAAPVWSGELRLRPGGKPYAHVSRTSVVLGLGRVNDEGVTRAVAKTSALRVVGVVDEPRVYLRKPTLLSQLVVPHARTPVRWHETTTRDRVLVSLDVTDAFTLPTAVETAVTCDALTGTEPEFDARGFAAPPMRRVMSLIEATSLAAWVGERNPARLKAGQRVEVVATREDMTRVVVDTSRYVAVGWVPSAMLFDSRVSRPPTVRMGYVNRRAGPGDARCAHDLPLIASVDGERAVVGTVVAGTTFSTSTLDVEPGFVSLALFEPWFSPSDEGKLLVRVEDLERC